MDNMRNKLKIYKSNTAITAQLICGGETVLGERFVFRSGENHVEEAKKFGQDFALKLISHKYLKISYDRGKSIYHGRVKAFAEGLRDKKIEF